MLGSLLKAKLSVPITHDGLVSRPNLAGKLQAGLSRKLILVSAQAGSGKTTAVSAWLHGVDYPTAWLTLDTEDNDAARFLAYLLAALRQIDDQIGLETELLLEAADRAPPSGYLVSLINDLSALHRPLILALDDYHQIDNAAVHELLTFLLEYQPEPLHIVIMTREDPPVPLARLRASGQVLDIRWADLRFSMDETARFVREIMALDVVTDDIAALQQRTEGWIAGLQLAALSMRASPDVRAFVHSFTGSSRFVLDYLFEEVFERQPADVQAFLLATSILKQLSAPLCDAVARRSDSRVLLNSLERANLFLLPLDPSRSWYRYHHLFAEHLRHRLRLQTELNESDLHRAASQWYEMNGDLPNAVSHALAAADWERGAALIQQTQQAALKRGEVGTLLEWYGRLPEEFVSARPQLCCDYSWPLLLSGELDRAEAFLSLASKAAQDDPQLLEDIAVAEAYHAWSSGDHRRAVTLSQQTLERLPADEVESRSILGINLGIACWHAGDMAAARSALSDAQDAARRAGNRYGELAARIFQSRVLAVHGYVRQAADELNVILDQAHLPITSLAYLDLSCVHYEWNEIALSEQRLAQSLELSHQSGNVEFMAAGYLMQACHHLGQGRLGAAQGSIRMASDIAQQHTLSPQMQARITACQIEIAIVEGDLDAASFLLARRTASADPHPFYRFADLSPSRLLLAQDRRDEAARHLAVWYENARAAGWGYGAIAVRVLQSIAASTPEEGLVFLADALQRAEPQGFVRAFVDAGDRLVPLLKGAARQGFHPRYVGALLRAFGSRADDPASGALPPVEQLSERELEVLRLVATGLSNRQIAEMLVLSLGTVKTHVHNIYVKLDAGNRAEAVSRAHDLGLV